MMGMVNLTKIMILLIIGLCISICNLCLNIEIHDRVSERDDISKFKTMCINACAVTYPINMCVILFLSTCTSVVTIYSIINIFIG